MKPACLTCGYPRFRPEGHAVWCEPHNAREEAAHGHPSLNCYTLHGCRCERCSALEAQHVADLEAKREARPVAPHPSLNWYTNKGCRCDECRQLMRAYNQRRRGRLTSALDTAALLPPATDRAAVPNGAVTSTRGSQGGDARREPRPEQLTAAVAAPTSRGGERGVPGKASALTTPDSL